MESRMITSKKSRFETWTNIDFMVKIPVVIEDGAPFSTLDGATLDARARFMTGKEVVGEASIAAQNTILVLFRAGTLPPGLCEIQVWAQVGQQSAMPIVFEASVRAGFFPLAAS
jgi:hypothetical protein